MARKKVATADEDGMAVGEEAFAAAASVAVADAVVRVIKGIPKAFFLFPA